MKVARRVTALIAGIIAASAFAQSAPQPLNLKLPPDSVPNQSASAAPALNDQADAGGTTPPIADAPGPSAKSAQLQPGVRYDDPDGMPEYADVPARPKCDDATYGQAQVHGDVTMGVVGGNHISGNYQSGVVNVSKAFGSCDHPTGGASISIGVGQGSFSGRRHWSH